jgi:molybdate transport system substrate-binding protein
MTCRNNRRTSAILMITGLAASLVLAGCGGPANGSNDKTTLDVLGAASLTETFTTLAKDFEKAHPNAKVKLAFDSSATLAEQVNQGAPADVLATADTATMQTVVDHGGTAKDPTLFATNHLLMVVPASNPAGIAHFSDLDKPDVKYVVCVDTAPCGKLADEVLADAGIENKPASEEVDVKAVLTKVEQDEADAGLVYKTDAVAGGDKVRAIDVSTTHHNLNQYPIAALKGSEHPTLAQEFADLVLSSKGQQVLADAGFQKP